MKRIIKKKVINIYYVQLIVKSIFKKVKKNQHYLHSMMNDVMKVILKVYQRNLKNMASYMCLEM